MPGGGYQKQRCTATSSQTGERCRKWAVRGHHVCTTHGGLAPQVQAKAEENLRDQILAAAPIAFRTLLDLAQNAQSEAVRKDAARDLFDRAGYGATLKSALAVSGQTSEASELDRDIALLLAQLDGKGGASPTPAEREDAGQG